MRRSTGSLDHTLKTYTLKIENLQEMYNFLYWYYLKSWSKIRQINKAINPTELETLIKSLLRKKTQGQMVLSKKQNLSHFKWRVNTSTPQIIDKIEKKAKFIIWSHSYPDTKTT